MIDYLGPAKTYSNKVAQKFGKQFKDEKTGILMA